MTEVEMKMIKNIIAITVVVFSLGFVSTQASAGSFWDIGSWFETNAAHTPVGAPDDYYFNQQEDH